jgi:hypothetical protein
VRYIENYPLPFISELRVSFNKQQQQRSFPLELVLFLEKELKDDPTKAIFRVNKDLLEGSETGDTTKMETIPETGTTTLLLIPFLNLKRQQQLLLQLSLIAISLIFLPYKRTRKQQ